MADETTREKKELKVEEIKALAEEKGCPVQKALSYITEFLSGPMCGRCFPCALGSYEGRLRLLKIVEGQGDEADLRALRRVAADMLVSSMCKKGKDTATFLIDWMETDVFREHIDGNCPTRDCMALSTYWIIPERCTSCGICLDACPYHAILGEKSKSFYTGYAAFEIRQNRCVKCDACRKVCPTEAIVIVGAKKKEAAGV